MFPPSRFRMQNIYGNRMSNSRPYGSLGPPDMEAGMSLNDMLNFINQDNQPQFDNQPRLSNIGQQFAQPYDSRVGHPGGSIGNPQDRNVILGPNALSQARIGLEPDKGDLLDPKTQANLALRYAELGQKGELGRERLSQTEELGNRKLDIASRRANIYEFKAKNPNLKFIIPKGGNVTAFNPLTGDTIDTGVDSGTLTDEDRLNIASELKTQEIGARGEVQKEITGMRSETQKDIQGMRGEQSLANIAARGHAQSEYTSSNMQRIATNNAARKLRNTRPDLAPYLVPDEQGNFKNTAPPDSPEYAFINAQLYQRGDVNLPNEKPNTTKPVTTKPTETKPVKEAPKAPKGWKYVPKAGGGWTAVEDKG